MNAPTNARAHLRPIDHDIFGGPIYDPVDLMIQAAPLPTYAAREHAALAHLTDAQALATWERMKAVRKAYVEAVLQEIAE